MKRKIPKQSKTYSDTPSNLSPCSDSSALPHSFSFCPFSLSVRFQTATVLAHFSFQQKFMASTYTTVSLKSIINFPLYYEKSSCSVADRGVWFLLTGLLGTAKQRHHRYEISLGSSVNLLFFLLMYCSYLR